MRRYALLLLAVGTAAFAAPEPTALDALKKEHAAAEGPVKKASDDAPFDLAKRDALDKLDDDFAARAFDLAKRDPADGLAAAVWAAKHSIDDSPRLADIARFVREYHFGKPEGVEAYHAISFDPAGRQLLTDTLAKASDRTARGRACECLARAAIRASHDPKATPADRAVQTRTASEHLNRLVREFDDVKTKFRGVPIAEADFAKAALFQLQNLAVGQPAPEAASVDLDGKPVRLADLRGKVVLLNFWATWCPPCRKLVPFERELVKRYAGQPFALVSVSCDEERADVAAFVRKHDMPWTHWYSGPSGLHLAWGATSIPTLYVLDARGVIRFVGGEEAGEAKALAQAVETLVRSAK